MKFQIRTISRVRPDSHRMRESASQLFGVTVPRAGLNVQPCGPTWQGCSRAIWLPQLGRGNEQ
eukprot:2502580-Prorocentrum_lima.AAC.1